MDVKQLKRLIEENEVEAIDLRYVGLNGRWYHITFPSRRLDLVLKRGIPFDGSSIPGMRSVEAGDMILIPDISTAHLDPFFETPTLGIICSVCDADTRIGCKKDPRSVAFRAHEYLVSTGIADVSLWIPELEFYLFNKAEFFSNEFAAGYMVSSFEDKKALPDDWNDVDGISQQDIKGYHLSPPFDRHHDIRQEMVNLIEAQDINIRYHHHEVGLCAQQEIETELSPFPKICDDTMVMKDIIRRTALECGYSATFMPKPVYNHAGNGMHFHIMLHKNGKNIFYKKGGYADLSKEALWFIGGILTHGRSIVAFTNPSTNSFKRLLPGFEAPVKLFFGLANRSAAIRIPKYVTDATTKRFEFRTGDATCNPYLAMSALLMAGIDGIKNKIDPTKHNFGPFDDNVFEWNDEKKSRLPAIPTNLKEAMQALQDDHQYLLQGNVFNRELIETHIEMKLAEFDSVENRPHPYEMIKYYSL